MSEVSIASDIEDGQEGRNTKVTHPPFAISSDEMMLRATLRGYWDAATARGYAVELKKHAQGLRGPGRPGWLIDVSDFAVQAGDVVAVIAQAVTEAQAAANPRPVVGLVGATMLGSMQARRLITGAPHRRFATTLEAETWLMQERAAA